MSKWMRENLWRHSFATFMCVFALFPLYLVVLSSFKSGGSLQLTSFVPREFSLDNYKMLFSSPKIPFLSWVKNSLIISSTVAISSVVIGAASAFAFSRLRFKGKKFGIQLLLLVQMFPAVLALSAVYVIMERVYTFAPGVGLGTQAGLILVYLGGSMSVNIWLLKGFVDSIPAELDEAAKIDGASPMQTYWLIFIPLATPVLAVVCLLMNGRTVAVGLQQFIGGQYASNWGAFAAGSILASIPIVIIFLSLQRYIVNGLTAGSVKG
jgi:arabinogalactan oligomer/maltooligosaccharide transport system permease protein